MQLVLRASKDAGHVHHLDGLDHCNQSYMSAFFTPAYEELPNASQRHNDTDVVIDLPRHSHRTEG